jgi:Skp family chaperone for outer membrane proteins
MKTLLFSAATAAALFLPTAANAQAVPAAVVAVVDLDRVTSQCNACKTAIAALNSQATAEQNREKALVAPLQTEQKSIQDAIDALAGKPADAALKARATAFQTKYEQAQQQAARGRQQLEANQAYVRKQILDKLNGVYQGVMQRRGANLLVEQGATLASTTSVDVTNDVLAALNAALPTVATTAPASAAPAAKQQPQGR